MKGILEKIFESVCFNCQPAGQAGMNYFYAIFRIITGLLFFQHGVQKVLGGLGGIDGHGSTVALASLLGLAGIIELVGGLGVAAGVFTRLFAFLASGEMLVAYFMAHAPAGLYPVLNKGELALAYFASFLVIAKIGAGKWSLERWLIKREIF